MGCRIEGDACSHLQMISGATGVDPAIIVGSLPVPVTGVDRAVYLQVLSVSLELFRSLSYLLFRGFDRLLRVMSLEDVACLVEGEGGVSIAGSCDAGARGFSMDFGGAEEGAPSSLVLEVFLPRDYPSDIVLRIYAFIGPSGEGFDPAVAEKVVRRVISYARRTRLYRRIEGMLAETGGDYGVDLEPGDTVEEGELGIHLSIYVSAAPGLLLPFDLNPVLDFAEYLHQRLEREAGKPWRQ